MRGKRADDRPDASVPDPSEPLQNPRHEQFARSLAGGASDTAAYVSAGYSEHSAGQSAHRLAKKDEISARVNHLQRKVTEKTVEGWTLTREWVLDKLKLNCKLALRREADGSPSKTFNGSVANTSLRLLGLEVGMFREGTDHKFTWDGDITKLDANQQAKLMQALETIAFKGDAEAKARAEAEVLREIDAPAAGAVQ